MVSMQMITTVTRMIVCVTATRPRYIRRRLTLLSACCVNLGIRLSSRKISRLLFNFLPDKSLATTTPMIVHTVG